MKFFAIISTGVLIEAPCSHWSWKSFSREIKRHLDPDDSVQVYAGTTWENKRFIRNFGRGA